MNSSQTIYGILDRDQLNELASDFYQELTLKTHLRNLCVENPGKTQTCLALFSRKQSRELKSIRISEATLQCEYTISNGKLILKSETFAQKQWLLL
jgi:reverse gyrase